MKNLKIVKASKAELRDVLRCIQMMNMVAVDPLDFDPRERVDPEDPNYRTLMGYYNTAENAFDYGSFLNHSMNLLGNKAQYIIAGYEVLIDRYCDPDAIVLQERDDLSQGEIKVKGSPIYVSPDFKSFNRKVSSLISTYGHGSRFLHVDNNGFETTGYILGNGCTEKAFPVTTYLLAAGSEVPAPYKSPSNN